MNALVGRRDVLKAAGAGLTVLSTSPLIASAPLRVLILGGTGFIGPHFVASLRARGHQVTLFNRGKSTPEKPLEAETLIGDRDGALDSLRGRNWDVVIDNSGYIPRQVRLTAELLKDRVNHYLFISSVSVYADLSKAGITEDAPLKTPPDPSVEEINAKTFGGLKAGCEQVVHEIFGRRATILRSVYIVGPGNPSDLFTYWPVRISRGGEVLAPGASADPVRLIDVRDLADFVRGCVESRLSGAYNVCQPPGSLTIGRLLQTSKEITGSDATFTWVNEAFLAKQGVLDATHIPIWASPIGSLAGMALISPHRALADGLRLRKLEDTVRDTLDWYRGLPNERRNHIRAGLSAERELQLLKQWTAARKEVERPPGP
jgi:2'-hydroxyisoflavone reductase